MRILEFVKQLGLQNSLFSGIHHAPDTEGAEIDWTAFRAPLTDRDRVLLSETHVWLRRVPRAFHPRRLCLDYPRAANQLARSWHDPDLVDRVLDQLLSDRRGGRLGFPPRIVEELKLLRRFHEDPYGSWKYVALTIRRPRSGPSPSPEAHRP